MKKAQERMKKIRASDIKPALTWSEWRGSNPRPDGPKPPALSAALHPDNLILYAKEGKMSSKEQIYCCKAMKNGV